jgi:iron complex outermembrane receptor protein
MRNLFNTTALAGAVLLAGVGSAHAQAQIMASGDQIVEEVVVTGTRVIGRLATDSAAPIDVISGETLRAQGATDISRALQLLAPSFNYPRSATAPSAANTRAATLRGLAPDQVLVLVNGKRWHSSSVINFNNVIGRGAAPVDLNTIPMAAIDRIEILRDGAAAQYGSDAIAGVINITLKSAGEGGFVSAQAGVTSEGDGQTVNAAFNRGFALGQAGAVNLSAEVRSRNSTNRATIDSRYGRVTNQQGDPDSLDLNLAANARYALGEAELYGDLVYDYRQGASAPLFRAPGVSVLYPNGFIPHVRLKLNDLGGGGGIRGEAAGWRWDVSDTFGYSDAAFQVRDTANTSLGAASPTRFDAGGARYVQNVINATVSRPYAVLAGANLALGVEQRHEGYEIRPGEAASFAGSGAQGFPGFNPPRPVDVSRNAVSAFADGELSPVEALNLGAAVRYEHYDDFGDALLGKLSLFYKPIEAVAVRATASTGFRAPALQQSYFSTVTSQASAGVLVNVGTFAVDDPVAKALGARPLDAETSRSLSGGVVVKPFAGLVFTADLFHIEIDDRIALSETLSGPNVVAILKAAGVTNASQARFFTNAVDTVTDGYELTANWRGRLSPDVRLDVTAGYMLVDTDIDSLKTNRVVPGLPLLGASAIDLLTKSQPQNKTTLAARLEWRGLTVNANLARFGPFRTISVATEQTFSPVTTADLAIDYALTSSLTLGAGVLNVGDVYPDKIVDRALSQGGSTQYPEVGAVGTNGREYFVRLTSRF